MADPDLTADNSEIDRDEPSPSAGGRRRRVLGLLLLVLAIGLGWAWLQRDQLAEDIIASQLKKSGLTASYEIVEVTPVRQVLRNIVVGDPEHPDLTIERAEIGISVKYGMPRIGRVRLERLRAFGSYRDGKLSFGELDAVLFPPEPTEPFALPDMQLELVDARALVEGDLGPIGIKAAGQGNLRGGFSGILAAAAPKLVLGGCGASDATLFGKVTIDSERPAFDGPLRLVGLACEAGKLDLESLTLRLQGRMDRTFDGLKGNFALAGRGGSFTSGQFGGAQGKGRFSWHEQGLTADYDLALADLATEQLRARGVDIEGVVRGRNGFERIEVGGTLSGDRVTLGLGYDTQLGELSDGLSQAVFGPVLEKLRAGLLAEGRSSRLAADFTYRKTGKAQSLVIPEASLRGASGQTLLSFSRLQASESDEGIFRLTGNFATGGRGLPRLSGRIEQGADEQIELRARMAEYSVADASVSLPELAVSMSQNGDMRFTGRVLASGPLPGGRVQQLSLPLDGRWGSASGLSLWAGCADVGFDQMNLAELELGKHRVRVCPNGRRAIFQSGSGRVDIVARLSGLALSGRLGGSRFDLAGQQVSYASATGLQGEDLDVRFGGETAHFTIPALTAQFDDEIKGSFSGMDAGLEAVPLDLFRGEGNWKYADGTLLLSEVRFMLQDREQVDRFRPLLARDAALGLADGKIHGEAILREPETGREVTRVDVHHDLGSGAGSADLLVDNLVFDKRLQPEMITPYMLGLIANTYGRIDGSGRIDWTSEGVTSTGEFYSDNLDFAAAFGPVEGASGRIHFTDLIGMVTAPDQVIRLRSMNPGIEVGDGKISYQITEGLLLELNGGSWPFLGGTLILQPGTIQMGTARDRHVTLELVGLDAARFVQQMDMGNLAATGTFDGTIPLMFNQDGGFIENGKLVARPPGGNLSYIGGLTYADMPAMAKIAFDALKSLDYRAMEVDMDGPIAGEIVTKVRFDGIRQGAGASRNFVTKQIAKLPIKFNVNIRAPFYKLITSIRAMYDPAFIRDPREIGLVDSSGRPLAGAEQPVRTLPPNETPIQPSESENER